MTEPVQKTSIGKGTYYLFIGNLVSTGVYALTAIIVGRLLGPSNYGLYSIALIVPTYVYLALRLGSSATITRYGAKYLSEGDEKKAVSFSYNISILHLAFGLAVVGLLVPFTSVISSNLLHRPELSSGPIIPVAVLSVVGQIMFNNGTGAFVGLHAFRKSALLQITNSLVKLASSVSLVLIGYYVLGAVAGYTLGFLVAGSISIVWLVYTNKSLIPRNVREDLVTAFRYAPGVYLSILVTNIISPVQLTLLASTVSNTKIGWYSAAVNIISLITLFTYPVTTVLLPLFSKTVEGGAKNLAATYNLSIRYTALFVVPVTAFIMALSTPIAVAVYGKVYEPSGSFLMLLTVVSLFGGLGSLSWSNFLYGVGKTREAFFSNAVYCLVSIGLSVFLVGRFGVYGVIIGTIAGSATCLLVGSLFVFSILQERMHIFSVWNIYLSSGITAAIVFPISLLKLNPYLATVGAGVIFCLLLIPVMTVTRALTRNDLSGMQEQFRGVRIVSYLLSLLERYHRLFRTQ